MSPAEEVPGDSIDRPGFERHAFRPAPFAFGLAFAVIGVSGVTGFSSDQAAAWLWVVALLVFGVAGVVAAVSRRS